MDKKDIIKETVVELLKLMNFEGDVFIDDFDKDNIIVNIQTDQAGFLIGQAGTSLDALQCIARTLVNKKVDESVKFILDINDYRRNKIDILKDLAKDIADQVLSKRVAVTLHPMPAYERRIIHLALVDNSQINTESIGYQSERRIIVRPIK
ncbi:MAG: R3H domain-containing nucleic acid-binding protein [Patescibacteria group bacterium]|nr:KH domain-containing protein [Patescibacteria group bacterium]